MRRLGPLALTLLIGCDDQQVEQNRRVPTSPNCLDTDVVDIQSYDLQPDDTAWDNDCDGYPVGRPDGASVLRDCDDNDDTVYPTAPEYNNGVDADCDGALQPLYGCGQTGYAAFGPWILLLWSRGRRPRTAVEGDR
jgi:hypothetical protein